LSKVAPQAVLRSSDISFPVDDMDIVLVDDVLYTGRTIRGRDERHFRPGQAKARHTLRADRSRAPRMPI